MSEDVNETEKPAEGVAPAAGTPAAEPEETGRKQKKPGIIRFSFPIVILLFVGGLAAWVHWGMRPLLATMVRGAIESQGLSVDDGTVLDASPWSASVKAKPFSASEVREVDGAEERHVIVSAQELTVDLGLWEMLTTRDVVVDELVCHDLKLNARRFEDGSLPKAFDPAREMEEEREDDEAPLPAADSILKWYERAEQWGPWMYEKLLKRSGEKEGDPPPPEPQFGWKNAVRHHPPPPPGSRWPRMIVRRLSLKGSLASPEEGPFDVTAWSAEGTNLTWILDEGEEMALDASLETRAAGAATLALKRKPGSGSLVVDWNERPIPVAALCRPEIAGEGLAAWGPSGLVGLGIDASWEGEALTGEIVLLLINIDLAPTAEAPPAAAQTKAALDKLRAAWKELAPNEPLVLTWRLELGGKPWAPTVTGFDGGGLTELLEQQLAALYEKGKDALLKKGTEEGKKLLEDTGKDLLENKDPKKTGEDLKKKGEDAKDAADKWLKGLGK